MSSYKYFTAEVTNLEYVLESHGLSLLPNFVTPLRCGYFPEIYVKGEIKAYGFQCYQELIGTLRRAVKIGRIFILLEVSLLSTHLALPRERHLE